MRKFLLAAILALLASPVLANDGIDPVLIMIAESGLDLADPTVSARLKADRQFKSNDPIMRSRVYRTDDKRRVKLIGHAFDKPNQVDKIVVTYGERTPQFEATTQALTQAFGSPVSKNRDVLTWRVENPNKRNTQSTHVRIIIGQNKNGKWMISADRRLGKKGRKNRRVAKSNTSVASRSTSSSRPQVVERD